MKCLSLTWVVLLAAGCSTGSFKDQNASGDTKKPYDGLNGTSLDSVRIGRDDWRPTRHVALVWDVGIDPDHRAYADHVDGRYTLSCEDESLFEQLLSRPSVDAQSVLAELTARDRCRLNQGIQPRFGSSLGSMTISKSQWNNAVLTKRLTEDGVPRAAANESILTGKADDTAYDGTAAAGLLAYNNDRVRLILLETQTTPAAQIERSLRCHDQTQWDALAIALENEDIVHAYANADMTASDRALLELIDRYGVTLVAKGRGLPAAGAMAKKLADKGCPRVDLRRFSAAWARLTNERARALQDRVFLRSMNEVLTLQAAGDDGYELATPADTAECPVQGPPRILVGGLSAAGRIASKSNSGGCVGLYAPSSRYVVAAPNGFYVRMDGTSVATALLARYVTRQYEPAMGAHAIEDALHRGLSGGKLRSSVVPQELSYDDDGRARYD
jgi:hypothetical protein